MRDFHDSDPMPVVSNFLCIGGDDHNWPPELDSEAKCGRCGLIYGEWTDDTKDALRGYQVTVFIPQAAPEEVIDIVFDTVADVMAELEDKYPVIKDRKGWDIGVSGEHVNAEP